MLFEGTLFSIKVITFLSLLLVNAYLLQSHDSVLFNKQSLSRSRQLRGTNVLEQENTSTLNTPSIEPVAPVALDAVATTPTLDATKAQTTNRTEAIDLLDFDDDDGGGAEQWKEELEDAPDFFDRIVMVEQK
jgi:hypothetical protein